MSGSSDELLAVTAELGAAAEKLRFGPPACHVYNPLVYAWSAHRAYLQRFGAPPKEVLLLGMNPGPWGMAQTGVPFGEVEAVRGWLGIEEQVEAPADCHPKKPVSGFACRRSEVSGRRLWGWAAARFPDAETFLTSFFVHNYCPLMFLDEGGRNLTPDRLARADREPLLQLCDRFLASAVRCLKPRLVVGVGAFAARRAAAALAGMGLDIGQILHPSPASPAANRGWAEQATRQLEELGVRVGSAPTAR